METALEEEEEGAVVGMREMRHVSLWKVENSFNNASDISDSAAVSTEVLLKIQGKYKWISHQN